MDHLFAPPAQLAPHLEQFRFWIWLQLIALRLYVRAVRGPGVKFRCIIEPWGEVWLDCICEELPAPDVDPFAFEPSRAFLAATGGAAPSCAHPGESHDSVRGFQSLRLSVPACAGINGRVGIRVPDT